MKNFLLILLVSVALVSCKDDNEKAGKNPQSLTGEPLPEWMTPRINEMNNSDLKQYFYIVKAKYELEDVYLFSSCCPTCLIAFEVYRADGSKIEDPKPSYVTNSEVVWKPEGFTCNVQ